VPLQAIARAAAACKASDLGIACPSDGTSIPGRGQAIAEAVRLTLYARHSCFKSEVDPLRCRARSACWLPGVGPGGLDGWGDLQRRGAWPRPLVAGAAMWSRPRPWPTRGPRSPAPMAWELKGAGARRLVESSRMGAYLGVSQGSALPRSSCHLTYRPVDGGPARRLVLIAGVTLRFRRLNSRPVLQIENDEVTHGRAVRPCSEPPGPSPELQPKTVWRARDRGGCENNDQVARPKSTPGDIPDGPPTARRSK